MGQKKPRIYMPCNFEVNLNTRLGVVALFSLLSLPNNVWRLIVFAPFLIIKSPKQQSLGDLLFLLRFLLLFLLLLFLFSFLSVDHELVSGTTGQNKIAGHVDPDKLNMFSVYT
jgi:energy-coupling factor transporter transmembrane protein EcfT